MDRSAGQAWIEGVELRERKEVAERVASRLEKLARPANPWIPIGFLAEVFPWAW